MEKEGFVRCVERVDKSIGVRAVSTDRHPQIRKLMATDQRFIHIIHQVDPWHLAKNLSKKLCKLGKKKSKFNIHLLNFMSFDILSKKSHYNVTFRLQQSS